MNFSICILFIALFCCEINSMPVNTNEALAKKNPFQTHSQKYLERFGYFTGLPEARANVDLAPEDLQNAEISLALSQFQLLNNLPVTGKLDEETMKLMGRPRCGVQDIRPLGKIASDYKWNKNTLTWSLQKHTQHMDEGAARLAMREALETWRSHIPTGMSFIEFPPDADVDMSIQFGVQNHGDMYPFDGKGMTLAHAMYPPSGQIHFDDDEKWVYRDEKLFESDKESVDLLQVAIHEFGHALGLGHSRHQDAVMAPFYPEVSLNDGFYKAPQLAPDDIKEINSLYGSEGRNSQEVAPITFIPPVESTTTTSTSTKSTQKSSTTKIDVALGDDPSTGCPLYIDAAVYSVSTSQSFIFADKFVWDFDGNGQLSNKRLITEAFPNGPEKVTAASSTPWNQFTTLINERQVYNFYLDPSSGRAELKSGPAELPKDVPFEPRAACIRHDGNQLLIQDTQLASYDEGRNMATFVGALGVHMDQFPTDATACLPQIGGPPGNMIVFAPGRYYLYDSSRQKVLDGYPRPLSNFMRC